jgi:hypothetical protein
VEVLGVLAAACHHLALTGIVEVGEARVVELEVAPAHIVDRPDLLAVRARQVAPELVDVRIHARVDRRRSAAVMNHARGGDRELRRHVALDARLQECEVLSEDRVIEVDLRADVDRGRRELDVASLAVELDLDVARSLLDSAELVDEVHVPRRAPELPVGRRLEPDLSLHLHDVADRLILGRAQLLGRQAPGGELLSRLQQLRRAEQAADVIRAKRR